MGLVVIVTVLLLPFANSQTPDCGCPPGQWRSRGSTTCQECPTGWLSMFGPEPGGGEGRSLSSTIDSYYCRQCQGQYEYQDETGQSECKTCLAGYSGFEGMFFNENTTNDAYKCVKCPAGWIGRSKYGDFSSEVLFAYENMLVNSSCPQSSSPCCQCNSDYGYYSFELGLTSCKSSCSKVLRLMLLIFHLSSCAMVQRVHLSRVLSLVWMESVTWR